MDAKILKEGDLHMIYLCGQLNYDTVSPFRNICLNHLYKEKVVFNCMELSFVGSKGITDFIETLEQMSHKALYAIKFCKVSSEFRRILESSNFKNLQIYEDENLAKSSFYQVVPTLPNLRSEGSYSVEDEIL